MGKYNHSKTRKVGEEVIQATRDLVDLEKVINGVEEAGGNNRGDYL